MAKGAVIAFASDVQMVGDQRRYTAEAYSIDAVLRITGATPIIFPALADKLDVEALLRHVQGVVIPGGLSNVHPSRYGRSGGDEYGPFDPARDATTLPLIRAVLDRGIPILMICRGFQELNVALGGTLKREPDGVPEETSHGTPKSAETEDQRYRLRHELNVKPHGKLATILQAGRVRVNSLHSQLIDDLGNGLVVEALADDGSIEAASVQDAKGFALGVIFHPDYWAERDAASYAILRAFAAAVDEFAIREALVPAE